jgi:hypothetical protein
LSAVGEAIIYDWYVRFERERQRRLVNPEVFFRAINANTRHNGLVAYLKELPRLQVQSRSFVEAILLEGLEQVPQASSELVKQVLGKWDCLPAAELYLLKQFIDRELEGRRHL